LAPVGVTRGLSLSSRPPPASLLVVGLALTIRTWSVKSTRYRPVIRQPVAAGV